MFFADQPILEPALDVPPGAYLEQAQSLDIGRYFPARVIEEIQARATVVERQPSWPVPTTTLAGGVERKTGMPVWRAAPPA